MWRVTNIKDSSKLTKHAMYKLPMKLDVFIHRFIERHHSRTLIFSIHVDGSYIEFLKRFKIYNVNDTKIFKLERRNKFADSN